MDIPTFEPGRTSGFIYTAIAIATVVVNTVVLRRYLSERAFFWCQLPATLLHELAHYVVALMTLCRVREFSAVPIRQPDGSWELGRVDYTTSGPVPFAVSLVAIAPLPVNLVAAYLMFGWYSTQPMSLIGGVASSVFMGYLLMGAMPSFADLRQARIVGVALAIIVFPLLWAVPVLLLSAFASALLS